MNLRPGIYLFLAATCASEATPDIKVDVPAHTHQDSKAPQCPNTYALSFAHNGGITTTPVVTTILTTGR